MNKEAEIGRPRRNCDVGTPEEQAERCNKYCRSLGGCSNCRKHPEFSLRACILAWAQMPYEAKEGGAK